MKDTIALITALLFSLSISVMSVARADEPEMNEIDRLAIVALEAPPLNIPPGIAVTMNPNATFGSAGGAILFGILLMAEAPEAAERAGAASNSIEELLSETDVWLPTKVLAEEVHAQLAEAQYEYVVVDPMVHPIPGLENRSYTYLMENWFRPIRSWYRSNPSEVNYMGIPEDVDLVIEIGVSNYSYMNPKMNLQVHMRLVDPKTKELLRKTRKWKYFKMGKPEEAFANEGELFKETFTYWGGQLINAELVKMKLVQK